MKFPDRGKYNIKRANKVFKSVCIYLDTKNNPMRAVIQRVERASVTIGGKLRSSIGKGLLVLAGISEDDTEEDIGWLAGKIARLRIFDDDSGVMNLSVTDIRGSVMVVSQFTLHAKTKKGNRPSYIKAAGPEKAIPLYNSFNAMLSQLTGKETATGEFGAMMKVELVNDGPVTIIIDTHEKE
jgi:D-tyrosyl-tRNA(Tyr) deacylase